MYNSCGQHACILWQSLIMMIWQDPLHMTQSGLCNTAIMENVAAELQYKGDATYSAASVHAHAVALGMSDNWDQIHIAHS